MTPPPQATMTAMAAAGPRPGDRKPLVTGVGFPRMLTGRHTLAAALA